MEKRKKRQKRAVEVDDVAGNSRGGDEDK